MGFKHKHNFYCNTSANPIPLNVIIKFKQACVYSEDDATVATRRHKTEPIKVVKKMSKINQKLC